MRKTTQLSPIFMAITLLAVLFVALPVIGAQVLIEAEAFDDYGGWVLDAQFVGEMHHGNTVTFRTRMTDRLAPFPDVPWDWQWIKTPPYQVPFRCLYSRNISNLMMAGKHISVTHIAGSSTKVMLNGGQHGVAVGCAVYLCKKHATTPRGVYEKHIQELRSIIIGRGQYKGALQRSESR